MLKTPLFPPLLHCAHCQADLSECPEKEFGDWIGRRLERGAKNVIEIAIAEVAVLGWR
jgi:hypothetical protein